MYGVNGNGMNGNGLENGRYNSYFEPNGRLNNGPGSTALYHSQGARYGLGINGRPNGVDSKMGGLHGPKHKRGDADRECTFIGWCTAKGND